MNLKPSWNGLFVLLDDFSIDLLKSTPMARQFLDLLYIFNLTQHVDKPTRTTRQSETLIDRIISNFPQRVKFTSVLPCSTISDHDAPYPCIDIRVTRFAPNTVVMSVISMRSRLWKAVLISY